MDALGARVKKIVRSAAERALAADKRVVSLHALGVGIALMMMVRLLGPVFADLTTWGWNDWDSITSFRYLTPLALKYRELPWWNPYACGGFPGWAYVEASTNLVSPYFLFYLTMPLKMALRMELLLSTVAGVWFTYLFAARFTASVALRTLVVVLYALNGRWALQVHEGHSWFLQYAWLPLILYLLDRALEEKRVALSLYAGCVMSLLVFMGGIYPLPHAVLIVGLYGLIAAVQRRSIRPIGHVAALGFVSLGISAPKLFPILELMKRVPRTIDSTEFFDFRQLLYMMTAPQQTFYTYPVQVPAYEWHEWGIYVGWAGVACLLIGGLFAVTPRENLMRILGVVLVVVGFGAFHPVAPWSLLHKLPIFSSQHVPSRFHYPAFLMLGVSFATIATRWLARSKWPLLRWDFILLVPVGLMAWDVSSVGRQSMSASFFLHAPPITRQETFRHVPIATADYTPRPRHPGNLLPMFANEGTLRCYGIPDGIPMGATAARKMAYLASGEGYVDVLEWTPNSAVVEVRSATPGAVLVYNMNWDTGWNANGRPALNVANAPAIELTGNGTERVEFRYRPPYMGYGLFAFVVTAGAIVWVVRRERRKQAAAA